NRSKRKDWVCFVCTDMGLDEETILRVYTMRWSIETYFKMSKSYLKLRTECHSTSYDAITSHMVVVAIRYMILAVERFENMDNRSLEELFYGVQRDIINEMMDCAVILILDIMLQSVKQYFGASDEQINGLVCTFIENLPAPWRERFSMLEAS
ncbi:MAG: transposase, partial [Lachnospiraceae bacterium]|nr:transposase [Lachnospiraceae bacterium]